MAMFKEGGYGSEWVVVTGDEEIDSQDDQARQLEQLLQQGEYSREGEHAHDEPQVDRVNRCVSSRKPSSGNISVSCLSARLSENKKSRPAKPRSPSMSEKNSTQVMRLQR